VSFEHRRDLLGIDALPGDAQIVIGDHREDGEERASDPVPNRCPASSGMPPATRLKT
jgi:hypothetical protein